MQIKNFLNGFLCHEDWNNKTLNFYTGCDTEEAYLKNCELKTKDWYYYNNPITYSFNSYGFRCNDIESLEDDYLLFTGCSFTEGVGLHLENTYPYIVAKNLNKTYYNLALGGTGPDVVKHNLIMFLSLIHKNKLPKCVVIQWPDENRMTLLSKNFHQLMINPWCISESLFKQMIEYGIPQYTNIFSRFATLQFLKNMGVHNIIELNSFGDEYFSSESTKADFKLWQLIDLERARDLSHAGIEAHIIQAKEILDTINQM